MGILPEQRDVRVFGRKPRPAKGSETVWPPGWSSRECGATAPPLVDRQGQMGALIPRLREARGLSQTALAQRAKIAREHLNRLEQGRFDPLRTLRRLAKALGVPVTELLE